MDKNLFVLFLAALTQHFAASIPVASERDTGYRSTWLRDQHALALVSLGM